MNSKSLGKTQMANVAQTELRISKLEKHIYSI